MSKYLKPDCELGYVEDAAEINYLKFNNMRHVILGCMLGDFNEEGSYIVSPEIVKELIEMPKYITETIDNMDVCLSELKLDKQISFLVTFEEDKATLALVEKLSYEANFKLNSGTYSNINEYILDTIQTSGEVNKNAIYKRWNISDVEGSVVDVFSCDESVLAKYFGLVNRFKYLLAANAKLLDKEGELEDIEAEYANEIVSILKRYPAFEKLVLAQLKDTYKEKEQFLQLNRPNFVKTFNEMLDNIILQNLKTLTDEQKIEFEKDLRNLYLQIYLRRTGVLDIETLNSIATLSAHDLLTLPLQELGAEFVKRVKNYKEIDKTGKEEVNKLKNWLVAQKLIVEKKKAEETEQKAEAEKAKDLVKAAAGKKEEAKKAAAKQAAAKKAAAKKAGAKKETKKETKKDSAKSDDKKKKEEEAKKKAEAEKKRLEEEARRRRARRRRAGYHSGYSVSIIAGMARNRDAHIENGKIKTTISASVTTGQRAGVQAKATAVKAETSHTAGV